MSLDYLLDTCVVSEFTKPKPERKVLDWLNTLAPDQTYLSVVTLGEIQMGISNLASSNRRTQLEQWLGTELLEGCIRQRGRLEIAPHRRSAERRPTPTSKLPAQAGNQP